VNKSRLQQALSKYAEAIKTRLKRQLRIDKTYATGELHDSIRTQTRPDTIDIFTADHVNFVERGRAAGRMPNIYKIREWAIAKGIGRGSTKREFARTTFNIARYIAQKGTIKRFGGNKSGSGFLEQVIEQLRPAMTDEFKESIAQDIMDNIRRPQNN